MTTQQALDIAWVLVCAALVMFMQAGFSSLESGMVRTKNSINVAGKNFADFCLTTGVFWILGFAVMFGASIGGWFGSDGFFFSGGGSPALLAFFVFQVGFAGTSTTIMSGAVAERMRFASYLIAALVFSVAIYPVIGHWAWGSLAGGDAGWLEELGFIDFAGSTVVHSVGGWMALAMVLILGPRLGRFGKGAVPIHGHDLPMVTLGVFILWVGWFGFNGGSTLGLTADVPSIIVNTVLAGAFGGLVALGLSWWHAGQADVPTFMNGSLAGLVGVTASANIVSTLDAVVIGAIAGVVMFGVTRLLERLEIDDVVGAVPVHLAAGIWGTLAVALFGSSEAWSGGSRLTQLGVQAIGVLVAFAWAFGIGFAVMALINRRFPLRIDPDAEKIGLNVAEHGASTEILDLLSDMDTQRSTSDFSQPVRVEPHTEIGQIAQQYNRVIDDINERTAALRLLQRIATAANDSDTIDEAFGISLDAVCSATAWPVGHVYLVDEEDANLLVTTDIWRLQNPQRYQQLRNSPGADSFRSGDGLPGEVLAQRLPAWSELSPGAAGPSRAAAARAAGLHIGVAVPVITGTEVAAVLEFFSEAARPPDDDVLQVLASAGTLLGRAVERRRSEQRRFQTVLDNMPAMVMLRDLEGRFILVNRQYEATYGVGNHEVRGKTLHDVNVVATEDLQPDRSAEHDRQVIAQHRTIEHELSVELAGRERTFASVKFPIDDHAGSVVAVGGIELDITTRKQHEAELAELVRTVELARDRAMAATETKSRFLASASHELRTPLNAIMGFTRLVQRHTTDLIDDRDAQNVDKILASAQNLLELINDLLDLSRVEAGRYGVEPVEFDMATLVRECVESLEPLVAGGVEMSFEAGNDLTVFTDRDKLRLVLINLLSNAVKFTDRGYVNVRIEPNTYDVALRVTDTGVGIPQAAIEKVFEPFHREQTQGREVQRGTGLGLTISREFARLLGGDLTAASELGAGSTFTVSIPIRYEAPQESAA